MPLSLITTDATQEALPMELQGDEESRSDPEEQDDEEVEVRTC